MYIIQLLASRAPVPVVARRRHGARRRRSHRSNKLSASRTVRLYCLNTMSRARLPCALLSSDVMAPENIGAELFQTRTSPSYTLCLRPNQAIDTRIRHEGRWADCDHLPTLIQRREGQDIGVAAASSSSMWAQISVHAACSWPRMATRCCGSRARPRDVCGPALGAYHNSSRQANNQTIRPASFAALASKLLLSPLGRSYIDMIAERE